MELLHKINRSPGAGENEKTANLDAVSLEDLKNKIEQMPVWKTLTLGVGPKSVTELENAIKEKGYGIEGFTEKLLEHPEFKISTEQKDVDLVMLSVEDLGFSKGASFSEIKNRIQEIGLELAPAEVGPQLCLNYVASNEGLYIGMEPIKINQSNEGNIFSMPFTGGIVRSIGPQFGWSGAGHYPIHNRFVFVRPQK